MKRANSGDKSPGVNVVALPGLGQETEVPLIPRPAEPTRAFCRLRRVRLESTQVVRSDAVLFPRLYFSIRHFLVERPPAPHWFDKLHLLGIDILLAGVVIVVIDWLVLAEWPR